MIRDPDHLSRTEFILGILGSEYAARLYHAAEVEEAAGSSEAKGKLQAQLRATNNWTALTQQQFVDCPRRIALTPGDSQPNRRTKRFFSAVRQAVKHRHPDDPAGRLRSGLMRYSVPSKGAGCAGAVSFEHLGRCLTNFGVTVSSCSMLDRHVSRIGGFVKRQGSQFEWRKTAKHKRTAAIVDVDTFVGHVFPDGTSRNNNSGSRTVSDFASAVEPAPLSVVTVGAGSTLRINSRTGTRTLVPNTIAFDRHLANYRRS